MESRRNTKAGLAFWTPAPGRGSYTSSGSSDDEQAEGEEDYFSQMDENGIIGLSEALEGGGHVEAPAGGPSEGAPQSQDVSASPRVHHRSLPEPSAAGHNSSDSFRNRSAEEWRRRGMHAHGGTTQAAAAANRALSDDGRPSSPPAAALRLLMHFSAEELASAQGIDAETFPEAELSDSLTTESHHSHITHNSPFPTHKVDLSAGSHSDSNTRDVPLTQTERDSGSKTGSVNSTPWQDITPRGTNRTQSRAAVPERSRTKAVRYVPPDLSKVESRVRFPKAEYKPPEGRGRPRVGSETPVVPLMFKSPADIVKEVLFSADGSSSSSDSASTLRTTVPLEFRSREQAAALLHQLQEDYGRLLTKYAEAENTIDRLRLEAKVTLSSEPLRASHAVQSAAPPSVSHSVSLDFPRTQRPQSDGHNTPPGSDSACSPSHLGQQLATILFHQAQVFLQQLQTFQDLLKNGKLAPDEQRDGLSRLGDGLDSLETGFLLIKEKHQLLQQHGVQFGPFDPQRELEGLIFSCGLGLEELKEQTLGETPPTSPPRPVCWSTPSQRGLARAPPQVEAWPDDRRETADRSVSSKESDEEDEHTLTSHVLTPRSDTLTLTDHDGGLNALEEVDHAVPLRHDRLGSSPLSAAAVTNTPVGHERRTQRVDGHGSHSQIIRTTRSERTDSADSRAASSRRRRRSNKSSSTCRAAASNRMRLRPGASRCGCCPSQGHSKDGIVSPEQDSGFVGSESSHLPPAAALSPVHQGATERARLFCCTSSDSVSGEGSSRKPASLLRQSSSSSSSSSSSCRRRLSLSWSSPRLHHSSRTPLGCDDWQRDVVHGSSPSWSSADVPHRDTCLRATTCRQSEGWPPDVGEGRKGLWVVDADPSTHTFQHDIWMKPLVSRATQTSCSATRATATGAATRATATGAATRATATGAATTGTAAETGGTTGAAAAMSRSRTPQLSCECSSLCSICGHPRPIRPGRCRGSAPRQRRAASGQQEAAAAFPALLHLLQPTVFVQTLPRVKGHAPSPPSSSLNRAIRAAESMKSSSRHMARSLAASLQHQRLLAHSL